MTPQQQSRPVFRGVVYALRVVTNVLVLSAGLFAAAQAHGQMQAGPATSSPDALTLSASGLNFGNHAPGSPADTKRVYIHNPGSKMVTLTSAIVASDGGGASAFALADQVCQGAGPLPARLLPGSSCYLAVRYLGSKATAENGTLTVTSDASMNPYVIALSGRRADDVSTIRTRSEEFVFPQQPVAVESNPQVFRFHATGAKAATLGAAQASGEFVVAEDRCAGKTLNPPSAHGKSIVDSCYVSVRFKPTASGIRTGSLTVPENSGAGPQVVHLMGTAAAASGALVASTAEINFDPTPEGTTNTGQFTQMYFTVTNTGSTTVTINSITTTGDFFLTDGLELSCIDGVLTLNPGYGCTLYPGFAPTKSSGNDTGQITISSTAGNTVVQLAGRALPATESLSLIPPVYNFGAVLKGTTAGAEHLSAVSVNNAGTLTVPSPSLALAGPNAADFSLNYDSVGTTDVPRYTCSLIGNSGGLSPGGNCLVGVMFKPSKLGPESATLTLTGDGGTHSITLSGTGVAQTPAVTVVPKVLVFDTVPLLLPLGAATGYGGPPYAVRTLPVSLTNTGSKAITIVSAAITKGATDFEFTSGGTTSFPQTLQPGQSLQESFDFVASTSGPRGGIVTFTDEDNHTYTAQLAGYAAADFDSATWDTSLLVFPDQSVTATQYGTATDFLQNTGNIAFDGGNVLGADLVMGPSTSGDFVLDSYGCKNAFPYGGGCQIKVHFQPHTTGLKRGSVEFNITYRDGHVSTAYVGLIGRALP